MMTTPPSSDSTSRCVRTSCPIADAAATERYEKIVANPSTKLSADSITVRRATRSSFAPVSWSRLTPAM